MHCAISRLDNFPHHDEIQEAIKDQVILSGSGAEQELNSCWMQFFGGLYVTKEAIHDSFFVLVIFFLLLFLIASVLAWELGSL